MKYQIKITSDDEAIILEPHLTIKEVRYWQWRICQLPSQCRVTAMVAKEKIIK